MTSSASKPGTSKSGMPCPLTTSRISSSCAIISSGAFSRVALYSAYCSCLNVGPLGSRATATRSGFSSRRMRRRVFVNPKTAPVGRPSGEVRPDRAMAKWAR